MSRLDHYWRVGVMVALVVLTAPAFAADWQLSDLMQLLSRTKSAQASFVENKYLSILDKPIESSGELSFIAPDRLEMHTRRPKPESMVLDGGSITMEQNGKRRTVSLGGYPEIAAFIESVRGTLAGDRQALEKVYQLELTGSAERWQLVLKPIQNRMSNIVKRIRIGGAHADVDRVIFDLADGDRTEMRISRISAQ
jgi:outer membrane lipoprotein-sorting protein